MGTRGLMGVVVDGEVKACYNHFDSYPDGLGTELVTQIREMMNRWGVKKMTKQARALRLVDENTPPTPEQIKTLQGYGDLNVGEQSEDDWYCLLRKLQGNLIDTLVVSYMIDGNNFAKDSLFCEWGYLVNLDDKILEVYCGFQKSPHEKGRFAELEVEAREHLDDTYYPIALICTFPLDSIPDDFVGVCEFSSHELYVHENGTEFDDVGDAINSLAVDESCVAYSVYNDDKTPVMNAMRVSEDEVKVENIEED